MTTRLATALPLLCLAAAAGAQARAGGDAVYPSAAIARAVPSHPDARHVFVLDSAHLLHDEEIGALQDSARALQRETGAAIAVVTLPTLHGGSVEEAALTIGRLWGVGSAGALGDPARNRGLVVLYVPDRSTVAGANLRVEVGRGLEGAITDGGGSRLILEALKPGLRAHRYGDAFLAGQREAARLIRADAERRGPAAPPERVRDASATAFPPALVVYGLVVSALFVLLAVVLVRQARRVVPPLWTAGDGSAGGRSSAGADAFRGGTDSSGGGSSSSDSGSAGGDLGGGGGFSGGGGSDTV